MFLAIWACGRFQLRSVISTVPRGLISGGQGHPNSHRLSCVGCRPRPLGWLRGPHLLHLGQIWCAHPPAVQLQGDRRTPPPEALLMCWCWRWCAGSGAGSGDGACACLSAGACQVIYFFPSSRMSGPGLPGGSLCFRRRRRLGVIWFHGSWLQVGHGHGARNLDHSAPRSRASRNSADV